MPEKNWTPWAVMSLLLVMLLSGCARELPSYPVDPPRVHPLPAEARQPARPEICLPTCPAGLTRLRTSLLNSLSEQQ